MTLPRTPIPQEKILTLSATGNWMQPGEQMTAQTLYQKLVEEPTRHRTVVEVGILYSFSQVE